MAKEIERKWFFDPNRIHKINWDELRELSIYQDLISLTSYINTEPELRVRHTTDITKNGEVHRFFAYKTGEGLSRTEVEFEISERTFNEFIHTMNSTCPLYIRNTKYIWEGPTTMCYTPEFSVGSIAKFIIEHRTVDPALKTGFQFIEVEFEDEDQARNFIFPLPSFREALIERTSEKMSHYWAKTRLSSGV